LAALSELPADEVVWEFPHSVALLGPWQYYHGYCILVARRHATELSGLDDAERRAYLDEMCLLARAVAECFHPHKLNYELLGNQVPHLHWHIFPRYRHDPDVLRPVWLALEWAERDEQQRRRLQTGPADCALTRNRAPAGAVRLSMPLYEYQCTQCKERAEILQKFTDPPYSHCPKCGGAMRKLQSSPAIQFKGSGFYKTDYASKKSEPASESKSEGKGESKGESKSESKSDSKSDGKNPSTEKAS